MSTRGEWGPGGMVCGTGAGSGTGRAGQVPEGKGLERAELAPAGPETLAAAPGAPRLGKEAVALDLGRRMWAKPEGQGPVPSPPVLAAPLGWGGVGDGLTTANPAEELWKGWLRRRGIFFLLSCYHFVAQLWKKSRA